MASRQGSEFAADPITTKPVSKAWLPDPVSPPLYSDSNVGGSLSDSAANHLLISQSMPFL